MKDKHNRHYKDYTPIPRRLLAYMRDKRYPIKQKHVMLYDILWHTPDADWENMESGSPIPYDVLMRELGVTNSKLGELLRELSDFGFIERIYPEGRERWGFVKVYFLAEPKGVKDEVERSSE